MNVICSIMIYVIFEGKEVRSNYTGRGTIISSDRDTYVVDFSKELKYLKTADGAESYRKIEVKKGDCVETN